MGPRADVDTLEKKNPVPLFGIEPRFLCGSAHSLVAIPAPNRYTSGEICMTCPSGISLRCWIRDEEEI